ncbi:MAG: hypothetical protein ACC619_09715 [Paracoccaceae bacterium]
MSRGTLIWVALLMIAIGLLPFMSVMLASAIAGNAGCLSGAATPCPFAGTPTGALLANMMLIGWYAVLSVPVGLIGLLLLLAALLRRRRSPKV